MLVFNKHPKSEIAVLAIDPSLDYPILYTILTLTKLLWNLKKSINFGPKITEISGNKH